MCSPKTETFNLMHCNCKLTDRYEPFTMVFSVQILTPHLIRTKCMHLRQRIGNNTCNTLFVEFASNSAK